MYCDCARTRAGGLSTWYHYLLEAVTHQPKGDAPNSTELYRLTKRRLCVSTRHRPGARPIRACVDRTKHHAGNRIYTQRKVYLHKPPRDTQENPNNWDINILKFRKTNRRRKWRVDIGREVSATGGRLVAPRTSKTDPASPQSDGGNYSAFTHFVNPDVGAFTQRTVIFGEGSEKIHAQCNRDEKSTGRNRPKPSKPDKPTDDQKTNGRRSYARGRFGRNRKRWGFQQKRITKLERPAEVNRGVNAQRQHCAERHLDDHGLNYRSN